MSGKVINTHNNKYLPAFFTESPKAPEQIRIKTLEEIKQEKAAKSQSKDGPSSVASEVKNTGASKPVKRTITKRESTSSQATESAEVPPARKRKAEEQEVRPTLNNAGPSVERPASKIQAGAAMAGRRVLGGVRVKTLDEIRREKAARVRTQQRSSETQETGAKKPDLLPINQVSAQSKILISSLLFVLFVLVTCCKVVIALKIVLHYEFANYMYHACNLNRKCDNREERRSIRDTSENCCCYP